MSELGSIHNDCLKSIADLRAKLKESKAAKEALAGKLRKWTDEAARVQRECYEAEAKVKALEAKLAAALEEIKGMREHHEKCEGEAVSAYRKMIDERNAALEANKILKSRLDYAENGDGRGL